ncbi:GerMN domain-containing protein [Clostridium sp. CX1]|uniref:GerMN domain-containing protein n=1 Tax=Clostridium tanneri TaxID=3037988 RepID=A0ABU4JU08_9CLOT|nr:MULTISPECIES: GerMN domain-containing protein [unclassified Clostridium]MCT8977529.1 GerMN domain-containing protein [Clostridium sp. CX1]MDW8801637.1 GerMN domain-containing protein [Clostridium sp. A1-XYC3]
MKKIFGLFICSTIMFSTLSLTGCEKKDSLSLNSTEKEKQIVLSKEKDNLLDLNIYFDSSKDNINSEISKEERVMKKDEIFGETIVNQLIKGPSVKSNLKPVLPKETRLISFSIKDNIGYVNLSKEANVAMTPLKAETSLKSIIWSLTQISSVEKVKILIDNKDTELWGGHYDLSKPLGKDDLLNVKRK